MANGASSKIVLATAARSRAGDVGPLFWIIIGVVVLLAIIMVVISTKNGSFEALKIIFGGAS